MTIRQRDRVLDDPLRALARYQRDEIALMRELLTVGYKHLARTCHPDVPGGSHDRMTALNQVRTEFDAAVAEREQRDWDLRRLTKQVLAGAPPRPPRRRT